MSMAQTEGARVMIAIESEAGEILVALNGERAPLTVENFLRYVDGGFYDGGVFHRTVTMGNQPQSPVKIEVIQGGPNPAKKADFGPVKLERTSMTGLHHVDGAISMARSAPDSATGDFFICIGEQASLDFGGKRNPDGQGFAAFGLVLKGMDVVRKIQAKPAVGQKLTPPLKILRVKRVQA